MPETDKPVIVIPGDEPPQIQDSPHLAELAPFGEVVVHTSRPSSPEEKVSRARDATVLINSRGQVHWRADDFRQLPNLKMITVCGIGTDSIDLEAAREMGIVVCNIPGKTAPIVAEHAFALLLAVSRKTAYLTREVQAGNWPRILATSLRGKTLGVIGTGNIGCEMIRLARSFGMQVLAWSFHPSQEKAGQFDFQYAELDEVLTNSDAVSLHVKLTDDSRQLIGAKEMRQMKPGSLLVNTARGAIVDTNALIDCLSDGHLGGAALDVFESEPIPADHPLLNCEQVVLTPHSADQTPEGIDLLNKGCVENVVAYFKGQPQNVVT